MGLQEDFDAHKAYADAEIPNRWATTTGNPGFVGHLQTTGTAKLAISIRDKLDATTAPTVSDDSTQDFGVGSKWMNVDVGNEATYFCYNPAVGAAVWVEAGGGSVPTVQEIVDGVLQAMREGHPSGSIGEGVMIGAAAQRNKVLFDWDAGTLAVYKADGTTVKYTLTISEPSATEIQLS